MIGKDFYDEQKRHWFVREVSMPKHKGENVFVCVRFYLRNRKYLSKIRVDLNRIPIVSFFLESEIKIFCMKNIVTFETARRLKEAGFPQPEPEGGQFWYDGIFQRLSVVVFEIGLDSVAFLAPLNAVDWRHYFSAKGLDISGGGYILPVFAPTATDILQEIPGHNLAFSTENGWHCFFMDFNGIIYSDFQSDNPAEAVALAWLAINKQQ